MQRSYCIADLGALEAVAGVSVCAQVWFCVELICRPEFEDLLYWDSVLHGRYANHLRHGTV